MVKKEVKTAKVVKVAEKTSVDTTALRGKDMSALLTDLVETRSDLAGARRSLAAGELVNPRVIGRYRKQIARLKTIIAQKALSDSRKEGA